MKDHWLRLLESKSIVSRQYKWFLGFKRTLNVFLCPCKLIQKSASKLDRKSRKMEYGKSYLIQISIFSSVSRAGLGQKISKSLNRYPEYPKMLTNWYKARGKEQSFYQKDLQKPCENSEFKRPTTTHHRVQVYKTKRPG